MMIPSPLVGEGQGRGIDATELDTNRGPPLRAVYLLQTDRGIHSPVLPRHLPCPILETGLFVRDSSPVAMARSCIRCMCGLFLRRKDVRHARLSHDPLAPRSRLRHSLEVGKPLTFDVGAMVADPDGHGWIDPYAPHITPIEAEAQHKEIITLEKLQDGTFQVDLGRCKDHAWRRSPMPEPRNGLKWIAVSRFVSEAERS